jgi:hypothetical protein
MEKYLLCRHDINLLRGYFIDIENPPFTGTCNIRRIKIKKLRKV